MKKHKERSTEIIRKWVCWHLRDRKQYVPNRVHISVDEQPCIKCPLLMKLSSAMSASLWLHGKGFCEVGNEGPDSCAHTQDGNCFLKKDGFFTMSGSSPPSTVFEKEVQHEVE